MSEEETQVAIDKTSDELKKKQFAASSKETKLGYEGKSPTEVVPAKKDTGESKSKTVPTSEHQDPGGPKTIIPQGKTSESSSDAESSSDDEQQSSSFAEFRTSSYAQMNIGPSLSRYQQKMEKLDAPMRTHQRNYDAVSDVKSSDSGYSSKMSSSSSSTDPQNKRKPRGHHQMYEQSTSINTRSKTDMDEVKYSCERI